MIDFSQIKVVRANRRTISIQISPNGIVEVKAPHFLPLPIIKAFIKSREEWVEDALKRVGSKIIQEKKYQNGEKFLYLGKEYELLLGNFIHIEVQNDKLLFPLALAQHGREKIEKWYIKQAKKIIKEQVDYCSRKTNLPYNAVSFSDTISKWGSCTHDNRLQFNWRLIMTPLLVIRYVVLHELVHTVEKNHSFQFWSKVKKFNPSYKQQIKWLKEHGNTLKF